MKMHKKFLIAALMLAMATSVAACGGVAKEDSSSNNVTSSESNSESTSEPVGPTIVDVAESVEMDAYEDKQMTCDLSGEVSWSSEDESIVTVDATGKISAVGKEGTTYVIAQNETDGYKYTVTVTNSGAKPALGNVEAFDLFTEKSIDLTETLSCTYKDAPVDAMYTITPTMGLVQVEGNTVTGLEAGDEILKIKATYKGCDTREKQVMVTVKNSYEITFGEEEFVLSVIEGDTAPTAQDVSVNVFFNGAVVEDTTGKLSVSVKDGADFVSVDGITVEARAVGTAVLTVTYTDKVGGADRSVSADLTVKVRDDFIPIEENIIAKFAPVGGTEKAELVRGEDDYADAYLYTRKAEWGDNFNTLMGASGPNVIDITKYKAMAYKVYFNTTPCLVGSVATGISGSVHSYGAFGDVIGDQIGSYENDAHKKADELVNVYDQNGHCLNGQQLVSGTWYTIVYDYTAYSGEWAYTGFGLSEQNATAYFKDFCYMTTTRLLPGGGYDARHKKAEAGEDPNVTDETDAVIDNFGRQGNEEGVTTQKVIAGSFTGKYKITSTTSNFAAGVTMKDCYDENGIHSDASRVFVSFDVYMEEGTMKVWKFGNNTEAHLKEGINVQGAGMVKCYNKETGAAENFENGKWYTVVVSVPVTTSWDAWYFLPIGDAYMPAVAYISAPVYSATNPMEP